MKYTKVDLNEQQQAVVDWSDGSLLVSAGPGSGKTLVVVLRIVNMIKNGVRPESILATTFTRKAADEMNKRLEARGVDIGRMSIQTMHAYCYRLLRQHKHFKNWKVDDKDQWRIVLKRILGYKRMNWKGVDITRVENFIAACRNNLIRPEEAADFMRDTYNNPRYAQAYFKFHEDMADKRLINFDDMLYYGVTLLEDDHDTLDKEQGRYQYVMVDEFQDSNHAQLVLADRISSPEFNLMAVGDVDQAIYSWRGALPEFMLEFAKNYKADVIELGINYRCAPVIVNAARKCIEHNENRLDKELEASRDLESEIRCMHATDSDEEAQLVREQIEIYREDEINLGQLAVLMRTNAQSRALEEELSRQKIPFVVLGAISFYQRKEIQDLLSYLRLLVDPNDAKAGERAITRPFRYINRKTLDRILNMSRHKTYLDAIKYVMDQRGAVSDAAGHKLEDFVDLVGSFNPEEDPPSEILRTIVRNTDFISYLQDEEGSDTPETSRAGNIGELVASATRFNTCKEFIDHVDMQIKLRKRNQRRETDARVQIMTIHKSKGTEYKVVFLIGANEGIIPHAKGDEEEERRLFYVAMTRAKNDLFVSVLGGASDGLSVHSMSPSRFAYEADIIPKDEEQTAPKEPAVSPVRQMPPIMAHTTTGHGFGSPRGDAATLALEHEMAEYEDRMDHNNDDDW
jgi:DNA helicase-2/ATP-dependent DNA helicase PcrA